MTLKLIIPAALLGALPFAAAAGTEMPEIKEYPLARDAAVSLQDAGQAAQAAHPGDLAAVVFGDEDGRLAWEAIVVDPDGTLWTVLIDAADGQVFASAATSAMNGDAEDHEDGHEDGETDDD
ncbi:PepSY domain-containing protein [Chachezhania sediminis]|uniref:PepSY domain-containing protein n=1 Tax=Chachezhania sediminis TaxID=2599291 RepID=UPI00131A9087|nr:PepSY domain-containing protein [Chachezhania sediminis]